MISIRESEENVMAYISRIIDNVIKERNHIIYVNVMLVQNAVLLANIQMEYVNNFVMTFYMRRVPQ